MLLGAIGKGCNLRQDITPVFYRGRVVEWKHLLVGQWEIKLWLR